MEGANSMCNGVLTLSKNSRSGCLRDALCESSYVTIRDTCLESQWFSRIVLPLFQFFHFLFREAEISVLGRGVD